jgi:hypothetical protein
MAEILTKLKYFGLANPINTLAFSQSDGFIWTMCWYVLKINERLFVLTESRTNGFDIVSTYEKPGSAVAKR